MSQKDFTVHGWARILLLILPYLFIVGMFQLLGGFISGVSFLDPDYIKSSEQQLVISFFGLLGTFLLLWIFMRYIDREKFIELGFQIKGRWHDFVVGTGAAFLIMLFGFFLLVGIDQIDFSGFNFKPDEILISVLLFLIVAVVEEALFRGYILKNLMLSTNKYTALFISSVLFSLMHGMNPNMSLFSFINLFGGGMILGITYIYTKNLWFPIGLHFGWNFFQTHLGFNVSGQDFYSLVEFNYSSGNLFNGGEFGFEGSIFSIIGQLLIFFSALYHYQRPAKMYYFEKLFLNVKQ